MRWSPGRPVESIFGYGLTKVSIHLADEIRHVHYPRVTFHQGVSQNLTEEYGLYGYPHDDVGGSFLLFDEDG